MRLLWNPYFITLGLLYVVNTFFGLPLDSNSILSLFFKNHFNDFLYMPITLTICLASIRWIKNLPYFTLNLGMIIGMTLFCSVIFEYIGPYYYKHATGDWIDVLMYGFGGLFYFVLQKNIFQKSSFKI